MRVLLRQCGVPDTELDAWCRDGCVRESHPGAINQWVTLHAALRGSFSRELRATGRPYIVRARLDKPPDDWKRLRAREKRLELLSKAKPKIGEVWGRDRRALRMTESAFRLD